MSADGTGARTYQLRQQMFALGDDYWIETDGGEPAFKVDGKALSVRKTLVLETPAGDELLTISRRLLSIRQAMVIEREGREVATVTKALITPLHDSFSVVLEGGEELEARGDILDHEYTVSRGGEMVAEVSKRWFRMRDAYGIEIAAGEDDPLILAVAVCFDQMSHNAG